MPQTRPCWLDTTLYPFDNPSINIEGHHTNYVDEGSGPIHS